MDVTTIRSRNVAMLVGQSGGPTEFGRRIDRDQAQVSQWTSATNPKPIGGRLARYIESRLGREVGWLDAPRWEGAQESQSQSVRLDPIIVRAAAKALYEVFKDELGRSYNMLDNPELFAELYERMVKRGLTSGNLVWLGMRIRDMALQGAPDDGRDSVDFDGESHPKGHAGRKKAKA